MSIPDNTHKSNKKKNLLHFCNESSAVQIVYRGLFSRKIRRFYLFDIFLMGSISALRPPQKKYSGAKYKGEGTMKTILSILTVFNLLFGSFAVCAESEDVGDASNAQIFKKKIIAKWYTKSNVYVIASF
jgi:hypothetical protein